ncbi:MAG: DUF3786 domain-containing protein [Treponema sp.]|jgi:hypothetical protein|nr:DUF3786 domain-containing protein [Treponema sp.]
MKKGYEQTYEWVISLLKDCDFDEAAARLKLERLGGAIAVNFLGRTYRITKDAVDLVKEALVWSAKSEGYDYNLKSVLGYYVLSQADAEPVYDFCGIGYFSHGIFIRQNWAGNTLSRVFGNDYQKFRVTAEKLGMVFEGEKASGQYSWRYALLPKIPVRVMYYEGDEEFPTKLQILFDKTAIRFYKFEPLAVLHECFKEGLAAAGEILSA